MDFVASEFGSAGGVCFGLLRRLQLWVEWECGDDDADGLANVVEGGDFELSAGGFDQSVAGVYVE
jgi:hypothetical protein